MKRTFKLPAHIRELHRQWKTGRHFVKGQPFHTFALVHRNRQFINAEMRKLVPKPENTTALEIGPGISPVIQGLPFKEYFLLEQSPGLAKELQRTVEGETTHSRVFFPQSLPSDYAKKWHIMDGRIEKLNFGQNERFGLVVANEVFTHVLEKDRMSAFRGISEKADALLVIDRPVVRLEDVKQNVIAQARQMLEKVAESRPLAKLVGTVKIEGISLEEQERAANAMLKHPLSFAKMSRQQMVDFGPMADYLDRNGWAGQLLIVEDMVVLKARRKSL